MAWNSTETNLARKSSNYLLQTSSHYLCDYFSWSVTPRTDYSKALKFMSQRSSSSRSSRESNILRVFAPTFLTTHKKPELLKNLIDVHDLLQTIGQEPSDRPRGLQLIANQIVSVRLIGHADKDIRLLSACCAVDILRIYAPEAPYNDEELLRIFRVIVNQLRGLATNDITSGTGSKMYYILNSLSVVKSCVVLVSLTKNGVEGAEDLLIELFNALISSIRTEHPTEIGTHMGSILQALIEEMDALEQDVLDLLLQPLFPQNKSENTAAFVLCQSVLRRTTASVEGAISNLVNQHLMAWTDKSSKDSELHENIYSLIYELHKVSSSLLLRILPNVCSQLVVEDEAVRLRAVKLLGKLFASPHAEFGQQFTRNFRDYLGRVVDVSPSIRLEVLSSCAIIMQRKPALRELTEESVVKKLRDIDGDVRLAALSSLLEVASEDPLGNIFDYYAQYARFIHIFTV